MNPSFSFNNEQFNRLFPFYFLINSKLQITSLGKSLEKLIANEIGKNFIELFEIPRPLTIVKVLKDLVDLENQLIVLETTLPNKLMLRGQFEYLKESNEVLFIGSPWFGSMEQVTENNLFIDDFAKHDPLIDLLHVNKSHEITNTDLKNLLITINKQKNELKIANKEIQDIALFPTQNPDPLFRINFSGDILQLNPAAEQITSLLFENKNYNIHDFFKFLISKLDTSKDRWIFEGKFEDKDFSFVCKTLHKEGYINIYGRDDTLQKANQQELEKLSLIIQQTQNAVVITDATGKIEWVNKSFERVTGYFLNEILGKTPGSFLQGKETDKETVAYMKSQIRKAQPFVCEVYNYKKSGEGYWLRINGQPIFNKEGKVIQFFAIEEDITFERQAQEKISAAANRMSSLITNLHAGVLLENQNRTISLINQRFCNLFKIPVKPNELIGTDCSQSAEQSKNLFVHPENFVNGISKILKNKKLVIGEVLEMTDGKFLERDFIPITNNGKYEGHLWVYTDITDKINSDKKLEVQRKFYEEILDNIPSDIAVFDKDHRYLYVNPQGIGDPEVRKWMVGKKDEDYAKKRNKPISIVDGRRALFNNVVETKKLKSWEEEIKQKDGSKKYILRNMYPVINNKEEVDLVIGYGVDITEIKNIQQQIEQSEKKYKDVIENSLAIVTTHDLDGKFLSVNPMVKKLYGYNDDEVIGKSLTDFMPEEDKLLFNENYLQKIKKEKQASGIFRVISKKGYIVYSLYNNYLKESPDTDPYVIGFAVDITDRIIAEKELKNAKKITEELAMAKQNFLANMSHEIRTPMNAIMGMANQLHKTNLNKEQNFYLDTIHTASENLLIILNDILDLSKIEAGELSIEKIGFEPKLVVGRAMQVMMHKAEEKGLSFTNSYCDTRLSNVLIGDPYRLNQILLNLISNAIKFTEKGGVDLICKVIQDNSKYQLIEATVKDSGIGMDDEFKKNIFEKFKQEDESVTRKFGGTGLGMSITKDLISLMEGEITVESKKGEGTSVSFRIPFLKGSKNDLPIKEVEKASTEVLLNKRVLITDDNEMNRLVATTILKNYGTINDEAQNGAEAIEKIKLNTYDIVLMDLQMPVMDGIEATKTIREKYNIKIPIIALTAFAAKGDRERFLEAGMNDYLSKPFNENDLLNVVAKWLNKKVLPKQKSSNEVASTQLYNLAKLKNISNGNKEFVNKMVVLFIDQSSKIISEIKEAFKASEIEKVNKLAHKIKPSLDTMGLDSLKDVIREIEIYPNNTAKNFNLELAIEQIDKKIIEVNKQLKLDFKL